MQGIKDTVAHAIENVPVGATAAEFGSQVKRAMKTYLFKKTKQSPMIIPIVHEL